MMMFQRRISQVVQPQTAATEGGYLAPGVADKAVKRRVSRVAMQEIEEEKKLAHTAESAEKALGSVDRILENVRKFSTYIPKDGGNVQLMDPALSKLNLLELLRAEIFFSDPDVDDKRNSEEEDDLDFSSRPPTLPVIILIYCNFSFLFNFVLLETLTSTLAMDQWGWKPETAIENMGFITMGAGGLGVIVFSTIGPLSKRFDERTLLMFLGILPMLVGRVIMFPFYGDHPPVNCIAKPHFSGCQQTCLETEDFHGTIFNESFFNGYNTSFSNISMSRIHDSSSTQAPVDENLVSCESGCSYDWCTTMSR